MSATGLLVGLILAEPSTPPACPLALRASVDVRTEDEGLDTGLVERAESRAQAVLRQWDVRPGDAEDDPVVIFELTRLPQGAGYSMHYRTGVGDTPVPAASGAAECRLCTESELLDQVEQTLDRVLPRLAGPQPASAAPRPEPPPPRVVAEAPAPMVDRPPSWQYPAGMGLSIGGALAFGLGGGLAMAEPLLDEDGAGRSVWPAGVAVSIAGAAMLTAGIVFVVREARTQSRRRRRPALHATRP